MAGYRAGGEELVEQDLHAVARGGFQGCVDVFVAFVVREGVRVVGEEVAQVEVVGGWFGDGDRSVFCGLDFWLFRWKVGNVQSLRLRRRSTLLFGRGIHHFNVGHGDGLRFRYWESLVRKNG